MKIDNGKFKTSFKNFLLIVFCFSLLTFSFPSPVFAQTQNWDNINLACKTDDIANLQGFECIFANILSIIIPLAGLAAFVVLIVGGFQYLTSAGDPKQLQKATGTITAAVIGIVIILGIWFIFKLLNAFTGLNLLQFKMPV